MIDFTQHADTTGTFTYLRPGSPLSPSTTSSLDTPSTQEDTTAFLGPLRLTKSGSMFDAVPIVAQWRQLASINPQSPDFLPLLSSLTSEGNRSSTTKLCGDDAGVTLGVINQVILAFSAKAI